jgi:chitinase
MIPQFLKTSLSGVLPTGAQLKAATIDPQRLLNGWNKIYDVSFERIGSQVVKSWMAPVTPNDRIFEIIGSYAYRVGFSMLQGDMNRYKRLILSNQNPKDPGVINKMIDAAMAGNIKGAKETLGVLQKIIGVFNYLNHEHLQGALSTARQDLVAEIGKADKYMPELKGILDIWKEFESDYYARAVDKATEYMLARITRINCQMPLGGTLNNPAVAMLIDGAARLKEAMNRIELSALIGKGRNGYNQGVCTELHRY